MFVFFFFRNFESLFFLHRKELRGSQSGKEQEEEEERSDEGEGRNLRACSASCLFFACDDNGEEELKVAEAAAPQRSSSHSACDRQNLHRFVAGEPHEEHPTSGREGEEELLSFLLLSLHRNTRSSAEVSDQSGRRSLATQLQPLPPPPPPPLPSLRQRSRQKARPPVSPSTSPTTATTALLLLLLPPLSFSFGKRDDEEEGVTAARDAHAIAPSGGG